MAKEIRTESDGPIRTFFFLDNDSLPSWRRYGSGFAEIKITSHVDRPYLRFVVTEYSRDTDTTKKTFVTLDENQGRKLYEHMKTLYEPTR